MQQAEINERRFKKIQHNPDSHAFSYLTISKCI